jgi:hypothetical protein
MRRTFSPSLLLRQLLPWPKQFDDRVNIKVGAQHVENAYSIIDLRNKIDTSETCGDDSSRWKA